MPRLILFNKPFGVLSQFTDAGARETLANFVRVPQVYPAGRLDRYSEGLLLLTDDWRLQARIAAPRHKMPKTYFVQVEGVPTDEDLERLKTGLDLKDGRSGPARVSRIAPPDVWERDPPVRFRKTVPDRWLSNHDHRRAESPGPADDRGDRASAPAPRPVACRRLSC